MFSTSNPTPISDPVSAMASATVMGFERLWRPVRRWNLGLDRNTLSNQVQQVKSAVGTGSAGINSNPAAGQSTQGVAKPVQNLRITRTALNATQVKVSIAFTPDQTDHYFQGVTVNLAQGSSNPVQVVSGKKSPLTLVLQRTSAASALSVQSIGALGGSNVSLGGGSPGRAVPLR